jgi:hypothetical protein
VSEPAHATPVSGKEKTKEQEATRHTEKQKGIAKQINSAAAKQK